MNEYYLLMLDSYGIKIELLIHHHALLSYIIPNRIYLDAFPVRLFSNKNLY